MARGYGWRCDYCGLIELKDINLVSYTQRPPERWYSIYRDLGVDRVEGTEPDNEWHLCSFNCLAEWTQKEKSP